MELSVAQAAQQLGVDDSRVQQMLRGGQLSGRRLGRQWLIESEEIARLAAQKRHSGRPMAPARAWALLDLLEEGSATWLSPVARSQTRALLKKLVEADADRWRAALRARSEVLRCRAHPSAIERLLTSELGSTARAGEKQASILGVDLVALGPQEQIYARGEEWPYLAVTWRIRIGVTEPNLVVRIPRQIWPFEREGRVSAAALAADLLESAEPRAVVGGLSMLRDLGSAAVAAMARS